MKIVRLILLVLVILQMPFCYRLARSAQLARYLSSLPREATPTVPFQDLRGSIHIHSAAGAHSLGTYPEIIRAAKQAGYDYVFITEHPKEVQLFNRLYDPDVVMIYGWEEERPDVARQLRSEHSEVSFFSKFTSGPVPPDVTGIEIFNLADNARRENNPLGWGTWLYHHLAYQRLFFFHVWELDREKIALWDQTTRSRKLSAIAGNNAHQNLGIVLLTTSGKTLFSAMVDPYEASFRFVTNHVILPPGAERSSETVLAALASGASYIAFEQLADPTGFSFHAVVDGRVLPMGTEVPVGSQLVFQSPIPATFKVIRSGEPVQELEGRRFEMRAEEAGPYRVEVYPSNPPSLIEGKPWILSNPIYVTAAVGDRSH